VATQRRLGFFASLSLSLSLSMSASCHLGLICAVSRCLKRLAAQPAVMSFLSLPFPYLFFLLHPYFPRSVSPSLKIICLFSFMFSHLWKCSRKEDTNSQSGYSLFVTFYYFALYSVHILSVAGTTPPLSSQRRTLFIGSSHTDNASKERAASSGTSGLPLFVVFISLSVFRNCSRQPSFL
jgi:hypothetical protein